MKEYLLFDLDGTLTDPKIGITTCVQYALKSYGIDEPDLDKLEPFIGPPLKESFMKFYGFDSDTADKVIIKYRERFSTIGLFENQVYRGIPSLLKKLKKNGMHLAVASSKPEVFVKRILEHFHLDQFFEVIVGSELDGSRVSKEEVVDEALRRLFRGVEPQKDRIYMIGDRSFDVIGARAMGIESIGVVYGYGGMEELKEAKADYIVRTVKELEEFLLRGVGSRLDIHRDYITSQKIVTILLPFIIFLGVRVVSDELFSLGLLALEDYGIVFPSGTALASILSFILAGAAIYPFASRVISVNKLDLKLRNSDWYRPSAGKYFLLLLVGATLGFNLLIQLTGIVNQSKVYGEVSTIQYSADYAIGLILYCVVSPLAEEMLFRGVLQGYFRQITSRTTAILCSSLMFGLYHGNIVQGIYAFVMGCIIGFSYEYFGKFAVTVYAHAFANFIAYTLSMWNIISGNLVSWPVCILSLLVAVAGFVGMMSGKNRIRSSK